MWKSCFLAFPKDCGKLVEFSKQLCVIPKGFPQLRQSWHFHKAGEGENVENFVTTPPVVFYSFWLVPSDNFPGSSL